MSQTAKRALKRNQDKVGEVYEQFQKEAGSKQEIDIESLTVSDCLQNYRKKSFRFFVIMKKTFLPHF